MTETGVSGQIGTRRLTERSDILTTSDEPATQQRILRRLEVLRQRLCIRWCGTAGAFAGFDHLRIDQQGAIVSGTVRLTVCLVEALEQSHVVEFHAEWLDGDSRSEVMSGVGRALEVDV